MAKPLHEATVREIRRVESELNRPIDWVACWAEIVELDRRAWEQAAPPEIERTAFLDAPVRVGRAELHRMSIGAWIWYSTAEEWYGGDARALQWAFWYAMAHARDGTALRAASTPAEAEARIFKWIVDAGVSAEGLRAAERALYAELPWAEEGGDRERTAEPAYGPVIAGLCKLKPDPDYWLWSVPVEVAVQRYRDTAAQDAEAWGEQLKAWASSAFLRWRKAAKAFDAKARAVAA